MITLDTNVLARFLLQDDPNQSPLTGYLLTNYRCYVPITVVLELAWVLKSKRFSKQDIIAQILEVLRLPNVFPQYQSHAERALLWANDGMDIADAIHLMIAMQENQLPVTTFDNDFIKKSIKNIETANCETVLKIISQ